MTRTLLYFILMLVCVGAVQAQPSPTRKGDQLDDYHGTKVPDAYRWLEDDIRRNRIPAPPGWALKTKSPRST